MLPCVLQLSLSAVITADSLPTNLTEHDILAGIFFDQPPKYWIEVYDKYKEDSRFSIIQLKSPEDKVIIERFGNITRNSILYTKYNVTFKEFPSYDRLSEFVESCATGPVITCNTHEEFVEKQAMFSNFSLFAFQDVKSDKFLPALNASFATYIDFPVKLFYLKYQENPKKKRAFWVFNSFTKYQIKFNEKERRKFYFQRFIIMHAYPPIYDYSQNMFILAKLRNMHFIRAHESLCTTNMTRVVSKLGTFIGRSYDQPGISVVHPHREGMEFVYDGDGENYRELKAFIKKSVKGQGRPKEGYGRKIRYSMMTVTFWIKLFAGMIIVMMVISPILIYFDKKARDERQRQRKFE